MEKNAGKDAISILKEDHISLRNGFKYFEQICTKEMGEKRQLAEGLCALFMQHAVAEEEIFYPAILQSVKHSRDMINEAIVEHAVAKELVAQIQVMQPDEDLYNAKVKVLGELIWHHIEEEESEIFEKAASADINLVQMGEMIEARKKQLAGLGGDEGHTAPGFGIAG